jgi:ligand-binding sensor domain-containing protein/signal transduction histidine kinase/CheY-like chemotaxis protein
LLLRFVTLLLLSICSVSHAGLPPVSFNTISSVDGLPQNTGRVMIQDKVGFVWIGTEDGLVRFDGHSMLSFRKQHNNAASLSDNYVSALAEDFKGRLWVGTMGGGLNVIEPTHHKVTRISNLENADIRSIVPDPVEDVIWVGTGQGLYSLSVKGDGFFLEMLDIFLPDGTLMENAVTGVVLLGDEIWISTRGTGIGRYNTKTKKTTWYQKGANGLLDNTFNTLRVDSGGTIWAGGQNEGLVQITGTDGEIQFNHYSSSNSDLKANDVMAIADAGNNMLWIGTWGGGLAHFNPQTRKMELYEHYPSNQYTIPSDIIMDILCTRDGQVWVGTFDRGVSWFNPDSPFHVYQANASEVGGMPSNLIWSFASGNSDQLWVGTGKGLSRLNLNTHNFETLTGIEPQELWESVRSDDIRALLVEDENLWISARKNGVARLSLTTGRITQVSDLLAEGQTLSHAFIRLIIKDRQGNLWFGATKGLNKFDPSIGKVRNYNQGDDGLSLPHYRIRALFEDSQNRIWVGTSDGLMLLDSYGTPVQVWKYSDKTTTGLLLPGKGIRGINEDHLGRIWLATEGGIAIFNEEENNTTILREDDGLPSNAAYSAVYADGYMWVSTLHGLARVGVDTLDIENYSTSDGLPDEEFNFNAYHKLADGCLVFGTLSGLTIFSANAVPGPEKKISPPVLKVQPYIYGEEGKHIPIEPGMVVNRNGLSGSPIIFQYNSLFFGKTKNVYYKVKLEGADTDWLSTESQRMVSYSGLSPGKYSFKVQAFDIHGQWEAGAVPITFTVAPKPWQTLQAYVLYGLALLGMILFAFSLYSRRLRHNAKILQSLVADRTQDLEESNLNLADKNSQLDRLIVGRERLYRVIAHELRTPLSMIMSILETMQGQKTENVGGVAIAYQNGTRIGRLLDNILDLAKKRESSAEMKELFEARSALEECLVPYRQQAQLQNKKLVERIGEGEVHLFMQKEGFIMMVSNLLSNGCKFTESDGTIEIITSVMSKTLQVEVVDDGVGLTPGDEEKIFHWFERSNPEDKYGGWGIGLAYVKEEAEMVGGTIKAFKRDGAGARFVLTLPIADDNIVAEYSRSSSTLPGNNEISREQSPLDPKKSYTVLIVEDNLDLLGHLPTLFPKHWTILTASDAESGWLIVLEKSPGLVLTDLMLPGESGFDLTRKLKGDERTAHIPIIILTALSNEENRLTGLGLSADSFVGKPFKNKELIVRVESLLANRERVFARARRNILKLSLDNRQEAVKKKGDVEDQFLVNLNAAMDAGPKGAAMALDEIASKLALSKRSFQREMERLGISWREYKRLYKLRYAMDLLQDPSNQIGEIAEKAGYSSSAHFSKIFKEHTGTTPSAWRNGS